MKQTSINILSIQRSIGGQHQDNKIISIVQWFRTAGGFRQGVSV